MKKSLVIVSFDQDNPNWHVRHDFNLLFLRQVQNHLNSVLQVRGHVLLNDLFDQLGLPRTTNGCTDGWLLPDVIDFGVFDADATAALEGKIEIRLEVTRRIHKSL